MQHAAARRIIDRLMSGSGAGTALVAQAGAARLATVYDCPAGLAESLLAAALTAPEDLPGEWRGDGLQTRPPRSANALVAELLPRILTRAADTARAAAALAAIADLWEHANEQERAGLRVRLLNGIAGHAPCSEAWLDPETLRQWSRDLPTLGGCGDDPVASLAQLPHERNAAAAYHRLARHCGFGFDPAALARALAGVAASLLETHHDPGVEVGRVLLGAAASARLAELAHPEQLAILLAQLAHQLWWSHHRADRAPVTHAWTATAPDLGQMVLERNKHGAIRAARAAALNPPACWAALWTLSMQAATNHPHATLRLAPLLDAVVADGGLRPDLAAAVAAVLCDVTESVLIA